MRETLPSGTVGERRVTGVSTRKYKVASDRVTFRLLTKILLSHHNSLEPLYFLNQKLNLSKYGIDESLPACLTIFFSKVSQAILIQINI